ncbi:MAG: glycoside hydrolase family 9 protein [Planctomycetota bacterium]|nr:glycoside hydrolase family 9 protein [Planctomycetota bacterium]
MRDTDVSCRCLFSLLFVTCSVCAIALVHGEDPYLVDLRGVANTSIEDDGIADNGKGGWSDEGINDMYLYPPLKFGTVTQQGYTFHAIDPKQQDKSVVMLRGLARGKDKPESATTPTPGAKGKFVYLLTNGVGRTAKGQPKDHVAMTCTVTYADATSNVINLRNGIELNSWWSGTHRERLAWPIIRGVNIYALKWKCVISVWAMQWQNPSSEKEIASLTFKSMNQLTPVIWAATISDHDFYASPERTAKRARRELPPKGYFSRKFAQERGRMMEAGIREGHFQGIRRVRVIRGDILEVAVDGGFAKSGAGLSNEVVAEHQVAKTFSVTSKDDADFDQGPRPSSVGRHSKEVYRSSIGKFPSNFLYEHHFYITLPKPLKPGKSYSIHVAQIAAPMKSKIELTFNDRKTITPVIKVNQFVYSPVGGKRYAYLGWWSGDQGNVDYGRYQKFNLIDEKSGQPVFEGKISERTPDHANSGESVYQMDFSDFSTAGRYHIYVPGLGRSSRFDIGGQRVREMYYHTMRAFFHQRCGQAFREPWTEFTKPACHTECWESGYLVRKRYRPKPGERKKSFIGGYHDAADFDTFTYHLPATSQILFAYELFPETFKDGDLDIPESGNGIPDVLDEARWGLFFWRDHQAEDGSVPLGRGNDCDSITGYNRRRKPRPAFGVLPANPESAVQYAGTAALYARLIKPFNAEDAASFLASAEKAYAFDRTQVLNPDDKKHGARRAIRPYAAAELYRTTGKQTYRNDVKSYTNEREEIGVGSHQGATFVWPYLALPDDKTDPQVRERLTKALLSCADKIVETTSNSGYRAGMGEEGYLGWGTANGGGFYGAPCLYAYLMTKDQKYLDAASLNADFQLGANPLSMTFITSIGDRFPRQPQISPFLYSRPNFTGETVKGMSVYGLSQYDVNWYPRATPRWRRYRDMSGGAEASSEFTVPQTVGPSAFLYMMLYALSEQKPNGQH